MGPPPKGKADAGQPRGNREARMAGQAAGFAVALVLGCMIETSQQARAESFLERNAEFRMLFDGTERVVSIDSFHWYNRGVYLP
jgi:hypothetical protein